MEATLPAILEVVSAPFWRRPDFLISAALGVGGLVFSFMAFIEARRAKRAATEAGRTVKLQTVTIELTEVAQKLDRIQPGIHFNEARDVLAETSRRLRRAVSPFAQDPVLSVAIKSLREALEAAQDALRGVRPTAATDEATVPNSVYFAIEGHFAAINNQLADLLGLFERISINFGEDHGKS